MCDWHGGSYAGNQPVKLASGKTVYVDPCIKGLVEALNDGGFATINSCCGHGQRPGWIALKDQRHILIAANHRMMRQMDAGFPVLSSPNRTPNPGADRRHPRRHGEG